MDFLHSPRPKNYAWTNPISKIRSTKNRIQDLLDYGGRSFFQYVSFSAIIDNKTICYYIGNSDPECTLLLL